jgi:hypothetical protein
LPIRALGRHRAMGHATHLLDIVLGYAGRVAIATLAELALVLGPFLLLSVVAQPVTLQTERWTEGLVGRRARWIAAGWLATALHEAGHAVFAMLFGHRVNRVKWFDFDAEDGTLGKVEHDYDPTSLYQRVGRLFIGVGPVLLGALVLGVAARLLLGVSASSRHAPAADAVATMRELETQLRAAAYAVGHLASALRPGRWQSWVFLYVAWVAGSAMRLSASDVRSFAAGAWTLVWLLLLANALTLWAGTLGLTLAVHAARAMALCDAALLSALALQAAAGAIALAATHALRLARTRDGALAGA